MDWVPADCGPISQAAAQFGIPVTLLGNTWQENMINHGYSRAGAVYGDVIWHVADRWNLTTGVRFTHDEKDFSWYNPTRTAAELDAGLAALAGLGFPLPPFPYQNLIQHADFDYGTLAVDDAGTPVRAVLTTNPCRM
jgi:iron complex outermembrane receptor protein